MKTHEKKLEPALNFLTTSTALGLPANTIMFIDTHSCINTGYLQYAGGASQPTMLDIKRVCESTCSKNGVTHKLNQLLDCFLGSKFLKAMSQTSKLGRSLLSDPKPLTEKYPNIKFANPGGLNIVIIMSCGPTMINKDHLSICEKMVAE